MIGRLGARYCAGSKMISSSSSRSYIGGRVGGDVSSIFSVHTLFLHSFGIPVGSLATAFRASYHCRREHTHFIYSKRNTPTVLVTKQYNSNTYCIHTLLFVTFDLNNKKSDMLLHLKLNISVYLLESILSQRRFNGKLQPCVDSCKQTTNI